MHRQELLKTRELAVGYRNPRQPTKTVLDDVSVELRAGELVCLIGPNGAGKSTLLRTLAGMQQPLLGQVEVGGVAVGQLTTQDLARHLSIVLTERMDVGNLLAYELVALGRYPYTGWAGRLSEEDHRVVEWSIQAVGAADLITRHVAELSDGERQKLMIARALAQETKLIILDEPTAFLDLPHRVELMAMLRELARGSERAVLASTHDLDVALRIADRLWLLPMDGPLQTGAPEDLVLNGALAQAFGNNGLIFDSHDGSFRIHRERKGVVELEGSGLPAVWTARALEREGFLVGQNRSPGALKIVVGNDSEALQWQTIAHDTVNSHDSIYTAVQHLKDLWRQNGHSAQ